MYLHYKKGLISLATLLGLLSFFIYVTKYITPKTHSFTPDQKAICYIDSVMNTNKSLGLSQKKYLKPKVTPQYTINNTVSSKHKQTSYKKDINKVTSYELLKRHHFPSKLANRVINYRKKLKRYTSMSQLENVYEISSKQLETLNKYYKVIN